MWPKTLTKGKRRRREWMSRKRRMERRFVRRGGDRLEVEAEVVVVAGVVERVREVVAGQSNPEGVEE